MSRITVSDLEHDRDLDRAAMSAICGGGGAPWVYGWITPYVESRPQQQGLSGNVVNVFDVTNNYVNNYTAGQMVNQFQSVSVSNTGNNAILAVSPNAIAANGVS
jgi:hypothetical protein